MGRWSSLVDRIVTGQQPRRRANRGHWPLARFHYGRSIGSDTRPRSSTCGQHVRATPRRPQRHVRRSPRRRRVLLFRWVGLPVTAALAVVVLLVSVGTGERQANARTAGTPAAAPGGGRISGRRRFLHGHRARKVAGVDWSARRPRHQALLTSQAVTKSLPTSKPVTTRVVTTVVPTTLLPTTKGPKPTSRPVSIPVPQAVSYVLVDVDTGNVLAGYNEHLRVSPASLTKVLTALIAIAYLSPKRRRARDHGVGERLPQPAWASKRAWRGRCQKCCNPCWYFQPMTPLMRSRTAISGTLRGFAPVMERSAGQIGMTDDPVFHDPAGLDGPLGFEDGNLVSARDMAIAGRDLLGVPELAQIVKEKNYRFVDPKGKVHWLPSMNFAFLDTYPGAVGIKTGFTDRAGVCIMAAATRDNRTMLAVVMNGYNPTETATDLLNQAFATPVVAEPTNDQLPPRALPSLRKVEHAHPGKRP